MVLSKLKVSTRLLIGFGSILMALVLIAVAGISKLSAMHENINVIVHENNVELQAATSMRATVSDRMIALRNVVLLETETEMAPQVDRITKQEARYNEKLQVLLKVMNLHGSVDAETKDLMQRINQRAAATAPLIAKVVQLGLANKNEEATKFMMNELNTEQQAWTKALNELVAYEEKMTDQTTEEAEKTYQAARNMMVIVTVLGMLIGTIMAYLIARSLISQLGAEPSVAVEIAERIAAGDLTTKIDLKHNDHHSILFALKKMRDNLAGIVGQVRVGTDTIVSASGQIAAGNLDLSSRTEQQASSLEETASSMEELTTTVKQNAENARRASTLATNASEVANKGGAVVSEVVTTMSGINESSRKISDIISVIDGIAFQTNILALNAAVEAARAGEQGRGFAVVATEVRNLAQRSASAAKEIKTLISDSVSQVEAGGKLVGQAGDTMQEIVSSVKQVTDLIGEIATASAEQTSGIEQINQAIAQMDQVTQQNSALVEEAAAATSSMQDHANNLSTIVSVFSIGTGLQQNAAEQVFMTAQRETTAAHQPAKKMPVIAAPLKKAQALPAPTKKVRPSLKEVKEVKVEKPRTRVEPATVSSAKNEGDWSEF